MTQDRFWDLLSKKTSGEANEAELVEFDEILLAHPDWKNISETLALLWQQTHPFENSEAEESFEKHVERMKKLCTGVTEFGLENNSESEQEDEKKYKPWIRKWWIPVAGVVVATLIFFILRNSFAGAGQNLSKPSPSLVSTKPGSTTKIQLPDGSAVWLNASSQLTYDKNFGRDLREVQLIGEAFFDVVKDPAHPFIIHTKVIDVKVLGTQFNVRSYPNDANTETSLIRGRVEVTVKNRGNQKYYLGPNEKVVVSNNIVRDEPLKKNLLSKPLISIVPLTYYPADSAIIETSWIENRLIFQENETFRDVALKMERKYGVIIVFADEKVAEYHVFGSFTKETISEALTALKIGFRFNYKIDGENITISQ